MQDRRTLVAPKDDLFEKAVDLGLPSGTLWMSGNLTKDIDGNYYIADPWEYGAYFQWTNVEGHKVPGQNESYTFGSPDQNTNFYNNKNFGVFTPLCSYYNVNIPDQYRYLDAAAANLGYPYRMPTREECQELLSCSQAETVVNGVSGRLFTGPNGNSVFFPFGGHWYTNYSGSVGTVGQFLTSSRYDSDYSDMQYNTSMFVYLGVESGRSYMYQEYPSYAMNIRPVMSTVEEFVDLGLPSGTLWSSGNLNCRFNESNTLEYFIDLPTGTGCYFYWGDLTGKASNYSGSSSNFTQSNYSSNAASRSLRASFTSGDVTYDAAAFNLGDGWRIPTRENFNELLNYCTWTYNSQVGAQVITGPNGNRIMITCRGYFVGSERKNYSTNGRYWTTEYSSSYKAYMFTFGSSTKTISSENVYDGLTIRPIKSPN